MTQIKNIDELTHMKIEAKEMAKYYFKGFSSGINTIIKSSEEYLTKKNDKLQKKCNSIYNKLCDRYNEIPMEELEKLEDKYILGIIPEIRRTLPEMKNNIDNFFRQPKINTFDKIKHNAEYISDLGEFYGMQFKRLVEEIKSKPEGKDFTVEIKDIDNKNFRI